MLARTIIAVWRTRATVVVCGARGARDVNGRWGAGVVGLGAVATDVA